MQKICNKNLPKYRPHTKIIFTKCLCSRDYSRNHKYASPIVAIYAARSHQRDR